MPGVSFSEGAGGRWDYTATDAGSGVFSFVQPIDITSVSGSPADILLTSPASIGIPELTVGNLFEIVPGLGVYTGSVAASTSFKILDGAIVVMEGNLADGAVLTVGPSGNFYSISISDIDVTSVNAAYNSSAFIGSFGVGSTLDFVLTLNRTGNSLASMILNGVSTDGAANLDNRSLSGSIAVPEPATMVLLGLGSFLVARRRRA